MKRLPKYADQVIDQARKAQTAGTMPPGLYVTEVRHDGWCALLQGTGPCNCNPEVEAPRPYFPAEEN